MAPNVATIAGALLALAVFFAAVEKLWPADPRPPLRRPGVATDLVYWFFTPLVTKTLTRVVLVLAMVAIVLALGQPVDRAHLEALLEPDSIVSRQPLWIQLVAFLLVTDLAAYAMHRLFHRGFLWRFHAVHHSSERVDWLSAVRLHPVNDALMRTAQAVPVLLLGFRPALLAAYVPLITFYAILVHANVPWTFGPLRWVFASPAFHRWHHAAEEEGMERNFAGLFPFIDLAFGTYHLPRGSAPRAFGIPGGDVPDGFVGQLVHPFRRRARRERAAGIARAA